MTLGIPKEVDLPYLTIFDRCQAGAHRTFFLDQESLRRQCQSDQSGCWQNQYCGDLPMGQPSFPEFKTPIGCGSGMRLLKQPDLQYAD